MRSSLKDFIKNNWIVLLFSIILAFIPFFWLKPGEMDLGGDGGRLYFYDPINQLKNLAFYYVSPFSKGASEGNFAYIPFISILSILKEIVNSPYILISINNVIKLVVGFLSVYLIIKEFTGKTEKNNNLPAKLTSILAGFFYLSTPAMIENYVKATPTHNQVFLNPFMFYFILRFTLTGRMKYAWVALIISLIFANNFSYHAAPVFFAFYPFMLIFILIYSFFIRRVKLPWKKLFVFLLIFLGLHAFHIVPEFLDLFTSGSNTNLRVFDTLDVKAQIGYFYGVLHIPSVSFHLLSYSLTKYLESIAIVIPLIVIFGLLFNNKKNKTILVCALFFLLTFFFVTGKTTITGIKFYELLFHIPGFTMFRNFYGQWQFSFYFFYSILFGLSLFSIFQKIKSKIFYKIVFIFLALYFTVSSWHFINGDLVNPFREEAKNVKAAIVMDPEYEDTVAFIRNIKDDGKILVLPFTDSYIQVIYGLNDGAYVGHSTIGQLTGKKDFSGYSDMSPYSDLFWQLSKEKNYNSIKSLLAILNIRYIFYNSDERIYDTVFSGRPYSPNYVRKYMPPNQSGYKEYIAKLVDKKIFEKSFYNVYTLDEKYFIPHFYTPDKVFAYKDDSNLSIYDRATAFFRGNISKKPIYIEDRECKRIYSEKICDYDTASLVNDSVRIQVEKINPTKYRIKITNAKSPYILGFLDAFNKRWKVYVSDKKIEGNFVENLYDKMFGAIGMRSLPDSTHFSINGYANAWYISPQDLDNKKDYELIVEMVGQRIFYVSLGISIVVFVGFLLWGAYLFGITEKLVGTFDKIITRR